MREIRRRRGALVGLSPTWFDDARRRRHREPGATLGDLDPTGVVRTDPRLSAAVAIPRPSPSPRS